MSLEIFFNSGSVAGLTRLVLSAVIMVILFRGKSQTARLLGFTFAGATAFNIILLVTDAMLPPFTDYLDPVGNCTPAMDHDRFGAVCISLS